MSNLYKGLVLCAVIGALLGIAIGTGITSYQHRKAAAQTEARAAHRTTTKAVADSAYYFDAGRRYEINRQLDENAHHAEALPATAPLLLPVAPAHQ